jgi:hypothetical protein
MFGKFGMAKEVVGTLRRLLLGKKEGRESFMLFSASLKMSLASAFEVSRQKKKVD